MLDANGLLLAIDKPVGWTSFDAVAFLRSRLKIKRIGHCGTLDPFATGLLLIALGRAATCRIDDWSAADKKYLGTIRFGIATDTDDITGTEIGSGRVPELSEVDAALPQFLGEQMQLPPSFSAIKVDGKKAYVAARKGKPIELAPRPITIHELRLLRWNSPEVEVAVVCSKGTYIRALARDIGLKLNTVATLSALRRTAIGEISVERAVSPQMAFEALSAGQFDHICVVKRYEMNPVVVVP
ncbi:MAG: tRNA pseudouridine(55) synthase TruB [bacterium]|nr:tRNA pseudouridine(55) synthase TruB [bacterium]